MQLALFPIRRMRISVLVAAETGDPRGAPLEVSPVTLSGATCLAILCHLVAVLPWLFPS